MCVACSFCAVATCMFVQVIISDTIRFWIISMRCEADRKPALSSALLLVICDCLCVFATCAHACLLCCACVGRSVTRETRVDAVDKSLASEIQTEADNSNVSAST